MRRVATALLAGFMLLAAVAVASPQPAPRTGVVQPRSVASAQADCLLLTAVTTCTTADVVVWRFDAPPNPSGGDVCPIVIDWGDGARSTPWDPSPSGGQHEFRHSYSAPGSYTASYVLGAKPGCPAGQRISSRSITITGPEGRIVPIEGEKAKTLTILKYQTKPNKRAKVGFVKAANGRCPATKASCAFEFRRGQKVQLRAGNAGDWRFVSWAGACTGKKRTCSVTMSSPKRVKVYFAPKPLKPITCPDCETQIATFLKDYEVASKSKGKCPLDRSGLRTPATVSSCNRS
jgi:hypothetical protein